MKEGGKEAVTREVMRAFPLLVKVVEDRADHVMWLEGKGFIGFCEYWMAFAKRVSAVYVYAFNGADLLTFKCGCAGGGSEYPRLHIESHARLISPSISRVLILNIGAWLRDATGAGAEASRCRCAAHRRRAHMWGAHSGNCCHRTGHIRRFVFLFFNHITSI